MEFSLLFFVIAGAAAFLVGASKGGLPMVGAVGVPLLALVMPPWRPRPFCCPSTS